MAILSFLFEALLYFKIFYMSECFFLHREKHLCFRINKTYWLLKISEVILKYLNFSHHLKKYYCFAKWNVAFKTAKKTIGKFTRCCYLIHGLLWIPKSCSETSLCPRLPHSFSKDKPFNEKSVILLMQTHCKCCGFKCKSKVHIVNTLRCRDDCYYFIS